MSDHGPLPPSSRACVIGVDVGGTKCAAGLVLTPGGETLARRVQPTRPERGGARVLSDVAALVGSLRDEAATLGYGPTAVGVGVAELVGPDGRVLSGATIDWRPFDPTARLRQETGLHVSLDADVRAAARAEGVLGAGRPYPIFLYVTVGTGVSASLVLGGAPYLGARGLTGTFASAPVEVPTHGGALASGPPLERFAAGPAIAERMRSLRPGFGGTAHEVLALAEGGDPQARGVVESAGATLGAAIGHLVNVLDPHAVVLGGGLGLAEGAFRSALDAALRRAIWSEHHRDLPLVTGALGVDAGMLGAALLAASPSNPA